MRKQRKVTMYKLIIISIFMIGCSSAHKENQFESEINRKLSQKEPDYQKWLKVDITPNYPPHILKRTPIFAKTQGERIQIRRKLGFPDEHSDAILGIFGAPGTEKYWPKKVGQRCSNIIYEHGQCDVDLYCVRTGLSRSPFYGRCLKFEDVRMSDQELADLLK